MRRLLYALCLLCAATLPGIASAQSHPVDSEQTARINHLAQRLAGRDTLPDETSESPLPSKTARPLGLPTAASGPAAARGSGAFEVGSGWILSTLGALGTVIGLVLALRWIYGRMGGQVASPSSPIIEVLSRTSIAPRQHVLLLRVGSRVLVVADGAGTLRTLAQIDDADEVADLLGAVTVAKPNSLTGGFNQLLGRLGRDYDAVEQGHDDQEVHVDSAREAVTGVLSRIKQLRERGDTA